MWVQLCGGKRVPDRGKLRRRPFYTVRISVWDQVLKKKRKTRKVLEKELYKKHQRTLNFSAVLGG